MSDSTKLRPKTCPHCHEKFPDRLLTPIEAAEMFSLTVGAMEHRRRRGTIPFVRLPQSRLIRYRLSTLMDLIESGERKFPA